MEMNTEDRAIRFARNVKDLNRFLVTDRVTEELYGYKNFVLSEQKLKTYYEHHEPNPAMRNFTAFRAELELRLA